MSYLKNPRVIFALIVFAAVLVGSVIMSNTTEGFSTNSAKSAKPATGVSNTSNVSPPEGICKEEWRKIVVALANKDDCTTVGTFRNDNKDLFSETCAPIMWKRFNETK